MIDHLLDILAVVGIGSGLIAFIAGVSYARQMHRRYTEDNQ
jgi:hypothetical protein